MIVYADQTGKLSGPEYGGPLDVARSKYGEFVRLVAAFREKLQSLRGREKLSRLHDAIDDAPPGQVKSNAQARAASFESQADLLVRAGNPVDGAVRAAESVVAKIRDALGFGVDPITIALAVAGMATAVAAMVAWIKNNDRLNKEIGLELQKLEAVTGGSAPASILDRAPGIGGAIGAIPGILAVGAALVFLPAILKKAR